MVPRGRFKDFKHLLKNKLPRFKKNELAKDFFHVNPII